MSDVAKWPEHLRINKNRRDALVTFACNLAGCYGADVYLCGSSLMDHNADPRDWDIRVTVSDADFRRRYRCNADSWERQGQTGRWGRSRYRWSSDCVKQSHSGMDRTLLNTDVQIYPSSYAKRFSRYPKLLLASTIAEREVAGRKGRT